MFLSLFYYNLFFRIQVTARKPLHENEINTNATLNVVKGNETAFYTLEKVIKSKDLR